MTNNVGCEHEISASPVRGARLWSSPAPLVNLGLLSHQLVSFHILYWTAPHGMVHAWGAERTRMWRLFTDIIIGCDVHLLCAPGNNPSRAAASEKRHVALNAASCKGPETRFGGLDPRKRRRPTPLEDGSVVEPEGNRQEGGRWRHPPTTATAAAAAAEPQHHPRPCPRSRQPAPDRNHRDRDNRFAL